MPGRGVPLLGGAHADGEARAMLRVEAKRRRPHGGSHPLRDQGERVARVLVRGAAREEPEGLVHVRAQVRHADHPARRQLRAVALTLPALTWVFAFYFIDTTLFIF